MSEQIFSENNIPFSELERFGLTRQMIGDLPRKTQQAILRGERSPVLPLRIRVGKKVFKAYSRFRLVPLMGLENNISQPSQSSKDNQSNQTNQVSQNKDAAKLSVLFLPQLKYVQRDLFTEDQISDLYSGETVKAALPDQTNPSIITPSEYYCQLDQKNRHLWTLPADHMEYNMKTLIHKFQLNKAESRAFITGTPVTVYAAGNQLTIGLDLRDPNGVRICNGDARQWQYEFDNDINKHTQLEKEYHFAINGCWIESSDGVFEYVDENDYDQTILTELQKQRDHIIREASSLGSFSRGR